MNVRTYIQCKICKEWCKEYRIKQKERLVTNTCNICFGLTAAINWSPFYTIAKRLISCDKNRQMKPPKESAIAYDLAKDMRMVKRSNVANKDARLIVGQSRIYYSNSAFKFGFFSISPFSSFLRKTSVSHANSEHDILHPRRNVNFA